MKVNRTQNLIADITIFVFALAIFYCGITTMSFSYFGEHILTDLVKNWNTHPVIDIVDSKGGCPTGYEPLLNDIWPGTVTGCYCPYILIGQHLSKGKCSSSQKKSSCGNVNPVGEIPLNNWDGVLLCAKRHPESYLYFARLGNNKGCEAGMKSCGRLDNLGKDYCVNPDENCFVNNISFSENSNGIQLGYGKFFSFSFSTTDTNNSPDDLIIDLRTSTGAMCIDPTEKNIDYKPYLLMDTTKVSYFCINKIDDKYFDDRYKLVDANNMNNYYNDNRLNIVMSVLPEYLPPPTNTMVSLYTRGYLGWKNSCLEHELLSPENVIASSEKIQRLNFYQYLLYLSAILYLIIMMVLLVIKLIFVTFNNNDSEAETALKIVDVVNFISIFFGLVVAIFAYSCGSNLINFFNALEVSDCGDYITNSSLAMLGNELGANVAKNKTSLWLYLITIVIIPLNIIIMLFTSKDDNVNPDMMKYIAIDENKVEEELVDTSVDKLKEVIEENKEVE
jgi:hypothetical protein